MSESDMEKYILPDLLIAKDGFSCWVDVKAKARYTVRRHTGVKETGIEARHFNHYLTVQRKSGIPGALVLIHVESRQIHLGYLDDLNRLKRPYQDMTGHVTETGQIEYHYDKQLMYFLRLEDFTWTQSIAQDAAFKKLRASAIPPKVRREWEPGGEIFNDAQLAEWWRNVQEKHRPYWETKGGYYPHATEGGFPKT